MSYISDIIFNTNKDQNYQYLCYRYYYKHQTKNYQLVEKKKNVEHADVGVDKTSKLRS